LAVGAAWLLRRREFVAVAWPIPPEPEEGPGRLGARSGILDEPGLPAFVAECPELTAREIRQRWAAGLECLVLWHEEAIAAYRWDATWAAGPLYLPYLGLTVRLAPGDSLVYDTFTRAASRRLRLGAELVNAAVARARGRGVRRCVGLVAAWNRASLGWAEHLGWEVLGTVGYRRVGFRRRYFATGGMAIAGDEVHFPPSGARGSAASQPASDGGVDPPLLGAHHVAAPESK
jgi:GNAT superfamily N-acetyltransferase